MCPAAAGAASSRVMVLPVIPQRNAGMQNVVGSESLDSDPVFLLTSSWDFSQRARRTRRRASVRLGLWIEWNRALVQAARPGRQFSVFSVLSVRNTAAVAKSDPNHPPLGKTSVNTDPPPDTLST